MLNEEERIARMNVPAKPIRLAIDTDAKNEVDDQFAIAWAAASPDRFRLEALYAAPFSHDCFRDLAQDQHLADLAVSMNGHSESPEDGMNQSYDEIRRILSLMNEETEGRVFRGSPRYLRSREEPVKSSAAEDLIRRCMTSEEPLYVVAIGALTNIASALIMEPKIADRMVLVWLGGHMPAYGHGIEFNLIQDVFAAQTVFDSGVPMIWVPCNNVASHLTISESELRLYLARKGPVSDALCSRVFSTFRNPAAVVAKMKFHRSTSLAENLDQSASYLDRFRTEERVAWSRIIWDISTIAALKNPNWTPSKLIPTPKLADDFHWLPEGHARPLIRQVTYCYRDLIFGNLFACLKGR